MSPQTIKKYYIPKHHFDMSKFHIITYDFHNSKRLGLKKLQNQIFEFKIPEGIATYTFEVKLIFTDNAVEALMGRSTEFEIIKNAYTGDLSEFKKEDKFDWFKFLEQNFSEQLEFAKERLLRKKKCEVPEITFYKEGRSSSRENAEFLQFDHSAENWAGPFEMGEKKGCIVIYGERKDICDYPVWDVKKEHSFYNLPFNTRKDLSIDENHHYSLTPEEKEKFFNSLSPREQLQTAEDYFLSKISYLNEDLGRTQPYEIYLVGNDDCSFTKWFSSKEEMEEELKFLRMMQPLNFSLDIQDRNYIFTN